MTQSEKKSVLSPEIWLRGLFMIVFIVINHVIRWFIWGIALIQFIMVLVRGEPHDKLVSFSHSLSMFSYQILLFVTFNREERPFPFSDWPEPDNSAEPDKSED